MESTKFWKNMGENFGHYFQKFGDRIDRKGQIGIIIGERNTHVRLCGTSDRTYTTEGRC